MPNQLDSTGLQVKSVTEIVSDLTTGLQAIYGSDINVSQNSPDGQLLNIFAQAASDLLELLVSVYNSFSWEAAFGVVLDQRVALNGITRRQGTFTIQPVSITVDRALTLYGLNQTAQPVYTVADGTGTQFQLITTNSFGGAGTSSLLFQAAEIGQVETTLNTITNQTTTVLGVTVVNNPLAAQSVGVNEETDVALKIRHAQSFALASTGPAEAIQAALLAIPDITDALVGENDANTTVSGIGAHSIWAIVEGGTSAEIGQAIYAKKSSGCGMTGTQTSNVTRPNGSSFAIKYDLALYENLWIHFGMTPKSAAASFDSDVVKAALVAALPYRLNQHPSIGDVVLAMAVIAPDYILTGVGVSDDNMTYQDIVVPTTLQYKFVPAVARITIT